ncbi:MAG: hypothetical protein K0R52_447 [Alphaproteobacteria bacterium]|jgi:hypothetical protein|nr:hypothetical protein [Alphaproteobacteria bacterium]
MTSESGLEKDHAAFKETWEYEKNRKLPIPGEIYGKTDRNNVLAYCLKDLLKSKELSPVDNEKFLETIQDLEMAIKKKISILCEDTKGNQMEVVLLQ